MLESLEVQDGENAEQLVSYILLANIAAEFEELSSSKIYLSRALPFLEKISSKTIYSSPIISLFAELVATEGENVTSIFLPFVGKKLVLPMVRLEEFKEKKDLFSKTPITLKDFNIAYFQIVFNPQEFHRALKKAYDATETIEILSRLKPLLAQIFSARFINEDYFGIARDNFILARITMEHSPTFSSFALQHANDALDSIKKDCSGSLLEEAADMQETIQALQEAIKNINAKRMVS